MANDISNYKYLDDKDNVRLLDLLSVDELQRFQDTISEMAGIAALTTDENGEPITEGSRFSRFCTDFCRKSPIGRKRCEDCDKMGAIMALEQGKPLYYYCHANLVDFAAPIMLEGRMIGSFIGGQVLADAPNIDAMRKIAHEIEVDEDEFVKAAQETNFVSRDEIERCTHFIYEFAQMLSEMAYKAYMEKRESELVLQAATAKTDFLANMSHEIRTPMNAIIGMSQIALREEMSKRAREYLTQIKSSADMLLTIINDILDYSKLEAGKMSIINVNYEPLNLIKDVSNIIVNRIANKNIEFIIDMDPSIPFELIGDDVRIKQVFVNLANNAIKFTNKGQVLIGITHVVVDSDTILLKCSVTDTGIGIKEEDIGSLFNSFEQVDSRRNRKVEGTGLGLAIVKDLVENMGGKIEVKSVYEEGSVFSFEIPQKVANAVNTIAVLEDCPAVLAYIDNPYIRPQIEKDVTVLGAQYVSVDLNVLKSFLKSANVDFVFVEDMLVTDEIIELNDTHPDVTFVVISTSAGLNAANMKYSDDFVYMPHPLSVITTSAILQNKSMEVQAVTPTEPVLDFTAPEADILIVDDNEVNLSVAEGLLEPVEMQIDLADNGFKAVEMAGQKTYDIIFMDHMMPDMDGLEATAMIRERFPEYNDIPIIALTANALSGNREMFLNAGLNDYVAKPIKFDVLIEVLKKYLPKDKLVMLGKEEILKKATKNIDMDSGISGMAFLDTGYALELLKSEKLYWKVLKDYYNMIDKKSEKIKRCEAEEDIGNYIVEVHALKSSSKQIGALSLSKKAENLEAAGNRHDIEMIHNHTDEMLEEYRNLQTSLAPYFIGGRGLEEDKQDFEKAVNVDEIRVLLDGMREVIDELDFDAAEEKLDELSAYKFGDEITGFIGKLREALVDMDIDGCLELIGSIEDEL
ncbi:MAG: PocR ligand-binding domain-containing protein [Bacteroidales bacterium]|nr:PocR ligand-binding domain-containing protein [Clostridium sp.]MCM1204630.1 PocR ligand-binding domain-containing protein [Bacteroidales bacterium]